MRDNQWFSEKQQTWFKSFILETVFIYADTITTDDEIETEGGEKDPWMPMVDEAMQQHEAAFEEMKMNVIDSGLDEQSAREKAYSDIFPQLQKELEGIYIECLLWMNQLKKDPVDKKIMQTKEAFVENDDFDPEEAIEAAIDMRKFFIKGF